MSEQYNLYFGTISYLSFDFELERMYFDPNTKWFRTYYKRSGNAFVEFTPYNKGSLYKVRKYYGYYELYYGTRLLVYSTTLQSIVNLIKKQ